MNLSFNIIEDKEFLALSKRQKFNKNYIINITSINNYKLILDKIKFKKFYFIVLNIHDIYQKNKIEINKLNFRFFKKNYKKLNIFITRINRNDLISIKQIYYNHIYKNELIIDFFENKSITLENFFIERIFDFKNNNFFQNIYCSFFKIEKECNNFLKSFVLNHEDNFKKKNNFTITSLINYLNYYLNNKNLFKYNKIFSFKRIFFEYNFQKIFKNDLKDQDIKKLYFNFKKNYPITYIKHNFYLIYYEDLDNIFFKEFINNNSIFQNLSITIGPLEFLFAHYYIVLKYKLSNIKNLDKRDVYNIPKYQLIKNFKIYKSYINNLINQKMINKIVLNYYINLYNEQYRLKGNE